MGQAGREQIIRDIIRLEERVARCRRCTELSACAYKPSFGKGDLSPDLLLVFECNNIFYNDENRLISFRNLFKEYFATDKVYHTFMVRCQPKACPIRHSISCFGQDKILNAQQQCSINSQLCTGTIIRPNIYEMLNCFAFLWEEIRVLQPRAVISFGEQVSHLLLKAAGVYENSADVELFEYEDITYLMTQYERDFPEEEVIRLSQMFALQHENVVGQ